MTATRMTQCMQMSGPSGPPGESMSLLRRKLFTASGITHADWRLIVEASAALLVQGYAACCHSGSLPAI